MSMHATERSYHLPHLNHSSLQDPYPHITETLSEKDLSKLYEVNAHMSRTTYIELSLYRPMIEHTIPPHGWNGEYNLEVEYSSKLVGIDNDNFPSENQSVLRTREIKPCDVRIMRLNGPFDFAIAPLWFQGPSGVAHILEAISPPSVDGTVKYSDIHSTRGIIVSPYTKSHDLKYYGPGQDAWLAAAMWDELYNPIPRVFDPKNKIQATEDGLLITNCMIPLPKDDAEINRDAARAFMLAQIAGRYLEGLSESDLNMRTSEANMRLVNALQSHINVFERNGGLRNKKRGIFNKGYGDHSESTREAHIQLGGVLTAAKAKHPILFARVPKEFIPGIIIPSKYDVLAPDVDWRWPARARLDMREYYNQINYAKASGTSVEEWVTICRNSENGTTSGFECAYDNFSKHADSYRFWGRKPADVVTDEYGIQRESLNRRLSLSLKQPTTDSNYSDGYPQFNLDGTRLE